MMRVSEIMERNPVVLREDMSLREVARILVKNNISGAPVVDSDGRIVGMLMFSDIINALRKRMESMGYVLAITPFDIYNFYAPEMVVEKGDPIKELGEVSVSEIMRRRVYTVREEDDLLDVIEVLSKKDVSRVPVVDSEGRVVGIVTRSDIIRIIANSKEVSDKVSED